MASLGEFFDDVRASRPIAPIQLDTPIPVEELHTPALLIDLAALERNLGRMQSWLDGHDMALRAHTKMHKCPVIAKMQIERGALGVCAAKVSEAEVMCAAGIDDVLVTSPIASPEKVERFIRTRQVHEGLKIVVDCEASARLLGRQAAAVGLTVDVIIDLDPGMGRTGISPGQDALALCDTIEGLPGLHFAGLQMYAGNCMHIPGFEARRDKYRRTMEAGLITRQLFEDAGIPVPVFTGGGTGTYDIEPDIGLMTELQAGSYAFMDIEYRDVGGSRGACFDDFEVSLFVLVTAISQPQSRMITVDGGFKSFAADKMVPEFRDIEGVRYHWGGDEHGIVQLDNPSATLALGRKYAMLTPHCDPTVNLHDFYFPYRDGLVSEIWPVTARGLAF